MSTLQDYKTSILHAFHTQSNREHKDPMEKYMRNHFPFLGIRTPERKDILRRFLLENGKPALEWLEPLVIFLYSQPEREFHYAALAMIDIHIKKLDADFLPLLEKLIVTNSWWDTIDHIAPKHVGAILLKDKKAIADYPDRWIEDDYFWLQRSAILFQLKYKLKTDEDKLFELIKRRKDSKEFFIQKAIGWALREYSKTAPDAVTTFIQNNELAPLSKREGMKHVHALDLR
ncbi:DNA alkylation repair protein [Bacillus tianshenii]|uniref:DNA alkylation repair protein n=1 Tax=Sutcliffiella tianshenii TaxID=1463404 RepID=UPI001CD4639E|nr:DNA alkylation repair protein [Bacillus tianshenii]MCA1321790.1 DNA alkylation repair protein [Bacillus tianshenii]